MLLLSSFYRWRNWGTGRWSFTRSILLVRSPLHSCWGHLCSFLAVLPKAVPIPSYITVCSSTFFPKAPFNSSILLFKMKQNNNCTFQAKLFFQNLGSLFSSSTLYNLLSNFISTPFSLTHPAQAGNGNVLQVLSLFLGLGGSNPCLCCYFLLAQLIHILQFLSSPTPSMLFPNCL